MFIARNFYVPLMCLAGIAVGAFVRANPAYAQGAVPPYVWLLVISLIFDLGTIALSSRLRIVPLTMNMRALGFVSGVVLYLLIVHVFGATPQGAAA